MKESTSGSDESQADGYFDCVKYEINEMAAYAHISRLEHNELVGEGLVLHDDEVRRFDGGIHALHNTKG